MIFWHILLLTYTIEDQTFVSEFVFRDQSTCANALAEIYPTIYAEYRDSMAQCRPTDVVSGYTVRPKARTNGGEKDG